MTSIVLFTEQVMTQSKHHVHDLPAGSGTQTPGIESPGRSRILTINGGSSSLKFALFERTDPSSRLLSGRVDRIGLEDARWVMAQAAAVARRIARSMPRTRRRPSAC